MSNEELIIELETIAFHAWPAKEVERLGGWYLRADGDVTRRANSVFPLDDPSLDIDDAINYVVEFYTSRKITPRFQVTSASRPKGLDEILAHAGFEKELVVAIETANLDVLVSVETDWHVNIINSPLDEWIRGYQMVTGYSDYKIAVRRGIMERISQKKSFASVSINDTIVSVGLCVVEGKWAGIFSLATHPDHRRKGLASAINKALATWAKLQGAETCYLQVEVDNEPALNLYHQLGFQEVYRYWYRQL